MTLTKRRTFPRNAWLVLIAGVLVIATIAFVSAVPHLSSTAVAKNMEPVEDLVKVYLRERGDEFQIDEVMEFSNHFYVIIQEVDTEINAFELLVDRYTGRISSEPGPNMMWNQKYSQR